MVASAVNVALHALRAPVYYSTRAAVRIPLHKDVRTELKTAVSLYRHVFPTVSVYESTLFSGNYRNATSQ